ncbi:MAG: transcriptional regulator [Clostridium sp. CAG:217_53_7]|nr:MAG: transcriptional regulator [Clostridium sp. CAG:217_53_7]
MNIEFEKQMGRNIRHIREEKGMTQELLSAKLQLAGCDITRSAAAKIAVGQRHIYPDEIRHIRQILSTTYEELFERQYN